MQKTKANETDFLREKSRITYESQYTNVDTTTGEILNRETEIRRTVSAEPDYIKIYYRAMMAVNDIAEIPLDFLLGLSAQIGYSNGDKVLFFNNRTTRTAIAELCHIGDNMVQKYIRRCVDKGVLFSTRDRGTYEVNPWLIAKGRWENIRKLQANFSFVDGKWERVIEEENESAD